MSVVRPVCKHGIDTAAHYTPALDDTAISDITSRQQQRRRRGDKERRRWEEWRIPTKPTDDSGSRGAPFRFMTGAVRGE